MFSSTPRAIDHAAKCLEDLRGAVDFIKDDEFIGVLREVKLRLGELRAILG